MLEGSRYHGFVAMLTFCRADVLHLYFKPCTYLLNLTAEDFDVDNKYGQ